VVAAAADRFGSVDPPVIRASAIRRVTAEVGLFCRSLTATRSRAAWTTAGDTRTCLRATGSSSALGYILILGHEVNLVDVVGVLLLELVEHGVGVQRLQQRLVIGGRELRPRQDCQQLPPLRH